MYTSFQPYDSIENVFSCVFVTYFPNFDCILNAIFWYFLTHKKPCFSHKTMLYTWWKRSVWNNVLKTKTARETFRNSKPSNLIVSVGTVYNNIMAHWRRRGGGVVDGRGGDEGARECVCWLVVINDTRARSESTANSDYRVTRRHGTSWSPLYRSVITAVGGWPGGLLKSRLDRLRRR